jgi:hypothetical protein
MRRRGEARSDVVRVTRRLAPRQWPAARAASSRLARRYSSVRPAPSRESCGQPFVVWRSHRAVDGGPLRQPPACNRRPARESRPLVLARLGHRPDPPGGARLVARHRLFQQLGCAMPRLSRRGRQDVPPLTHVGRSRRVPRCRRGGVRLCAALECDSSQISARMNERRTRLLLAVRQVSAEAMFGARRWVKSRPLEPPVRPAPSNVRHRKQPPGCVLNRGRP